MTSIYSGRTVNGWCVYVLRDDKDIICYVGKGKPERVYQSARKRRLNYEIVAANLHEREAFEIEARFINLLGPERLQNEIKPDWPGLPKPDHAKRVRALPVSTRHTRLKGDNHPRSKLRAEFIPEIRRGGTSDEERRALAEKFGVSAFTIYEVQRRNAWRDVPD